VVDATTPSDESVRKALENAWASLKSQLAVMIGGGVARSMEVEVCIVD